MESIILGSVIVKAYTVLTLLTVGQEIWNYNNPRPFPKKEYILINWDQGDFKKVNNEWVLMTKHRWDKPFKANARKKYYGQNK